MGAVKKSSRNKTKKERGSRGARGRGFEGCFREKLTKAETAGRSFHLQALEHGVPIICGSGFKISGTKKTLERHKDVSAQA